MATAPAGAASPAASHICCHRCRGALARPGSVLFLCSVAAEGAKAARHQQATSTAASRSGAGEGEEAAQAPLSALVEPLCWMVSAPTASQEAQDAPASSFLAPAAPDDVQSRIDGSSAEKLRCPCCGAKVGAYARTAWFVPPAAASAGPFALKHLTTDI